MDSLDFMIRWEQGDTSDAETIKGFQALINTGLAWKLQGCYGRMASALIEAGHCTAPNTA